MSNNKMLSENIGFEISDVSNYIHDIKEMSQYFEFFDSEESGVFTGSYFRFLLSEGFPSIGLLIFQLHIYLDEIIHQKSYMKQPNSKHVSLHVFCRLLKKRFVSTYKKPNYKIIARIASILFEHLDGLTISEDYVKQLCRAKTKRNNISKPISQSKFLELLAKKSSKSEKNTK